MDSIARKSHELMCDGKRIDISKIPMRKIFEQYNTAKLEMELIEAELPQFRVVTDSVKGSMDEYPYLHHNIAISGMEKKTKQLLEERKEWLATMRYTAELFLSGVQDTHIASILRMKYMEMKTWEEIAAHMGAGYSVGSIKMSMQRFWSRKNVTNVTQNVTNVTF